MCAWRVRDSAVGFFGRAGTLVKKEAGEGSERGCWVWGGLLVSSRESRRPP